MVAQEPVASGPVPLVRVADSRKALGLLGSRFYGDPSARSQDDRRDGYEWENDDDVSL